MNIFMDVYKRNDGKKTPTNDYTKINNPDNYINAVFSGLFFEYYTQ